MWLTEKHSQNIYDTFEVHSTIPLMLMRTYSCVKLMIHERIVLAVRNV